MSVSHQSCSTRKAAPSNRARVSLLIALAVLLADVASKYAALHLGTQTVPDTGSQPVASLFILLACGLVLLTLRPSWPCCVAVGLAAGAGASNLIERLVRGSVTNFIPLPGHAWMDVADILLFVAVLVLCGVAVNVGRGR